MIKIECEYYPKNDFFGKEGLTAAVVLGLVWLGSLLLNEDSRITR